MILSKPMDMTYQNYPGKKNRCKIMMNEKNEDDKISSYFPFPKEMAMARGWRIKKSPRSTGGIIYMDGLVSTGNKFPDTIL